MSELRAAIGELGRAGLALGTRPNLPVLSQCQANAAKLAAIDGPSALPPAYELDALRRDLGQACERGDLANVPGRILRRAPLVLWSGEPSAPALPGLLDVLLDGAARRPRWLLEMIEAWLRDFAPERPGFARAGASIAGLLAQATHPRLRPWQAAHQAFRLFDVDKGPRSVARSLLLGADAPEVALPRIGMDGPLRPAGKFFRAAMAELLGALPEALRGANAEIAWQRAEMLLEVPRIVRDRGGRDVVSNTLRFADGTGAVAQACLAPWLTPPAPSLALRQAVIAFLLRNIGDPRLRPGAWAVAGEQATQLMRSWLSEESLEEFLALIEQEKGDKAWRYRQKFWRACFRAWPGCEVWVVLGSGLATQASARRNLSQNFGRLIATGQSNEQAVLLIRMGRLVLSEWSNVGPVRAWNVDDRWCPSLYRERYTEGELREASLDFPDHPDRGVGGSSNGKGLWHRNSEQGLWQDCAAALLRAKLNLRLNRSDYLSP